MLLTVCASSFAGRIRPIKGGSSAAGLMDVTDLPAFIRNEVGCSGMAMTTPLLAGCDRDLLARIVLNADKVGCPCLALIEPAPLPLEDEAKAVASEERLRRIVQAGQWLGCSSICVRITAPDDEDFMLEVSERLRPIIRKAEKVDINVCIGSAPGLTSNPDRVTELLKKIGGFRVGTLPDFASAARSGDAAGYLRRLVPYASTVLASVNELVDSDAKTTPGAAAAPKPRGKKSKDAPASETAGPAPKALGLADCVSVVEAVGFDGSLAIDFTGRGDALEAVINARKIIQGVLGGTPDPEDGIDLASALAAIGAIGEPEEADVQAIDIDDDEAEPEGDLPGKRGPAASAKPGAEASEDEIDDDTPKTETKPAGAAQGRKAKPAPKSGRPSPAKPAPSKAASPSKKG
ncbi:MAG: hypothetical protein ACT4PL_04545 [Phycisphaerales bacterium]